MTKMAVMPIFGKKKASKNLTPHDKKGHSDLIETLMKCAYN